MSEQDYNADDDSTLNIETEETTEESSQETLESDSYESQDDWLTQKAREFKEKRREENRQAREALKKLPQIEAELEKQKFFKSMPDAEDYEKEIDEFRAKNPWISLDKSYRYVLADVNPTKLAEISDRGVANQNRQNRTTINDNNSSFNEQINGVDPTTIDEMKQRAEKASKDFIW